MTTRCYWIGIIGVAGKGANYEEPFSPNKTIGELIRTLRSKGLGAANKRIEIFKFRYGDMSVYDKNDPYWAHSVTLGEYATTFGKDGNDVTLIYCVV